MRSITLTPKMFEGIVSQGDWYLANTTIGAIRHKVTGECPLGYVIAILRPDVLPGCKVPDYSQITQRFKIQLPIEAYFGIIAASDNLRFHPGYSNIRRGRILKLCNLA